MKRASEQYMHEKTWEEKAQENPLYGVMSHEEFVDSGAEPTQEELDVFYVRGREMVSRWIHPWLVESGASEDATVLEFGCGMGRLTNAVADHFKPENVYGIDISATMISHAKKNTKEGCSYCTVDENGNFPLEDQFFDRVYSYAVFQHISTKSVVEKSIAEIARVLKDGGHCKLNIQMNFAPPYENGLRQDTHAFENKYLVHGWKKVAGIPLWGMKIRDSNNWSGIRLGYKQLSRLFRENGIQIYGVTRDPSWDKMVWFHGMKS